MTKLMEFPPAPIVGLPMKVGEGYAIVSVVCQCRPTNTAMIIRGVDVGARCMACGTVYAITAIAYDRVTQPEMRLTVGPILSSSKGDA